MAPTATWRRKRELAGRSAAAVSAVRSARAEGWPSMAPLAVISSVLAFLLYYNTLDADFAYDDSRAIKTNPDILPSTPLTSLLLDDFWGTPLSHSGSHKSYRPVTVLSFRLNYLAGGLRPWGYHLVNVLLHSVACALFAQLAARLFGARSPAAVLASLLFVVHPVHTEAVAGVVGRADVGAAIFFLLSFFSYSAYLRQRDLRDAPRPALRNGSAAGQHHAAPSSPRCWRPLLACFVCAALAMFTKEHGVTVMGVCIVYDLLVYNKFTAKDLSQLFSERYRRAVEGPGLLVAMSAALLAVRLLAMGSKPPEFSPSDNPAADSDSLAVRALTFLHLPVVNLGLLLCPSTLSFDWSMDAVPLLSPADPRNLLTLALYAGAALLATSILRGLHADRRTYYVERVRTYLRAQDGAGSDAESEASAASQAAGFGQLDAVILGAALLVIPFLPASNLFFYVGFVVAERVLYIPSMGFCLLVAAGFRALRGRLGRRGKMAAATAAVGLLLAMACRTYVRNLDWRTEERLYRAGIAVNPPKAYGNLANILSSNGMKEEAERAYKRALSYRSNMADVHYNLGILYQEQKRYDEALQSYDKAIQYRPRMAMAHLNKGLVLGLSGQREAAAAVYRHCSTLDGAGLKDPRTHEATKISALFNLGRLHADEGSFRQAIAVYQEAIERMPAHYQPQSLYNMLGEAFFKVDRLSEAEHWYKEALRAKPDHVPAHLTYGKLLAKMGRPAEAEAWFVKAMELAPNDPVVYQHYDVADGRARAAATSGRLTTAVGLPDPLDG
ncbi:protein O-mannosyl-transferase TMTC2-like isoform X2 [Pollicipes pollicipes]|uniref:protein O-mannosyl-transferase TMTC2-like isoform X2 n=1 Tax=Pollicipes pollicipes TaxID=41117 RepID=UPI0018855433|nr:protein O-mannosyl-transferase TMTC2-like isoform X2 [Pollicipes pollicipes]